MPAKKSNATFVRQVYSLTHGEYSVLTPYVNCKTKVLFRHNTRHPHTFYMKPANFLSGQRCPRRELNWVKIKHLRAVRTFYKYMKHFSPDIVPVTRYIGYDTPIIFRHNTKNPHLFKKSPSNFKKRPWCTKCHIHILAKRFSKGQTIFNNEVRRITGNEYSVLGKYKNAKTDILMRHNTSHPHTFYITPDSFLSGSRCIICAHKSASRGEHCILKFLLSHGLVLNKSFYYGFHLHTSQNKRRCLHADFYIPHLSLVIEFDGPQHFRYTEWSHKMTVQDMKYNLMYLRHNDRLKDVYCARHHLYMFRIENRNKRNRKPIIKLVNKQMTIIWKDILPYIRKDSLYE